MRNLFLLIVVFAIMLLMVGQSNAQCPNNGAFTMVHGRAVFVRGVNTCDPGCGVAPNFGFSSFGGYNAGAFPVDSAFGFSAFNSFNSFNAFPAFGFSAFGGRWLFGERFGIHGRIGGGHGKKIERNVTRVR